MHSIYMSLATRIRFEFAPKDLVFDHHEHALNTCPPMMRVVMTLLSLFLRGNDAVLRVTCTRIECVQM